MASYAMLGELRRTAVPEKSRQGRAMALRYDASLNGAGIAWISRASNGTEVCMGVSAKSD